MWPCVIIHINKRVPIVLATLSDQSEENKDNAVSLDRKRIHKFNRIPLYKKVYLSWIISIRHLSRRLKMCNVHSIIGFISDNEVDSGLFCRFSLLLRLHSKLGRTWYSVLFLKYQKWMHNTERQILFHFSALYLHVSLTYPFYLTM
jgi:hypothetical protein